MDIFLLIHSFIMVFVLIICFYILALGYNIHLITHFLVLNLKEKTAKFYQNTYLFYKTDEIHALSSQLTQH